MRGNKHIMREPLPAGCLFQATCCEKCLQSPTPTRKSTSIPHRSTQCGWNNKIFILLHHPSPIICHRMSLCKPEKVLESLDSPTQVFLVAMQAMHSRLLPTLVFCTTPGSRPSMASKGDSERQLGRSCLGVRCEGSCSDAPFKR